MVANSNVTRPSQELPLLLVSPLSLSPPRPDFCWKLVALRVSAGPCRWNLELESRLIFLSSNISTQVHEPTLPH